MKRENLQEAGLNILLLAETAAALLVASVYAGSQRFWGALSADFDKNVEESGLNQGLVRTGIQMAFLPAVIGGITLIASKGDVRLAAAVGTFTFFGQYIFG